LIESNAAWECKEAQSGFVASRLIKLPHHHLMDHGWMMDPLLSSLQAPDVYSSHVGLPTISSHTSVEYNNVPE